MAEQTADKVVKQVEVQLSARGGEQVASEFEKAGRAREQAERKLSRPIDASRSGTVARTRATYGIATATGAAAQMEFEREVRRSISDRIETMEVAGRRARVNEEAQRRMFGESLSVRTAARRRERSIDEQAARDSEALRLRTARRMQQQQADEARQWAEARRQAARSQAGTQAGGALDALRSYGFSKIIAPVMIAKASSALIEEVIRAPSTIRQIETGALSAQEAVARATDWIPFVSRITRAIGEGGRARREARDRLTDSELDRAVAQQQIIGARSVMGQRGFGRVQYEAQATYESQRVQTEATVAKLRQQLSLESDESGRQAIRLQIRTAQEKLALAYEEAAQKVRDATEDYYTSAIRVREGIRQIEVSTGQVRRQEALVGTGRQVAEAEDVANLKGGMDNVKKLFDFRARKLDEESQDRKNTILEENKTEIKALGERYRVELQRETNSEIAAKKKARWEAEDAALVERRKARLSLEDQRAAGEKEDLARQRENALRSDQIRRQQQKEQYGDIVAGMRGGIIERGAAIGAAGYEERAIRQRTGEEALGFARQFNQILNDATATQEQQNAARRGIEILPQYQKARQEEEMLKSQFEAIRAVPKLAEKLDMGRFSSGKTVVAREQAESEAAKQRAETAEKMAKLLEKQGTLVDLMKDLFKDRVAVIFGGSN